MTYTMYVITAAEGQGHYRHIRISSEATLLQLHEAIVSAYGLRGVRAPSFMPKRQKKGERLKYSLNRTKTTVAMRDVRLKDTVFSTKGYMTYALQEPQFTFNCRTLEVLESDDPETEVVASSGGYFWQRETGAMFRQLFERMHEVQEELDELALLEKEMDMDGMDMQTVVEYLLAAGNLYGIIPLDILHTLYCAQQPAVHPLSFEMVALYISSQEDARVYVADARGQLITEENMEGLTPVYLVDYSLVEEGMFHEVLAEQAGKPYYKPAAEELLRYAEDDYQEQTPQYLRMRQALKDLGVPVRELDNVMFMLICEIQLGRGEASDLFYVLDRYRIRLKGRHAVQRMLDLYADMSNNTRLHFHCGHTPEEVVTTMSPRRVPHAAVPPPEQKDGGDAPSIFADPDMPSGIINLADFRQTPSKPGRNAPCPCGSGKKYKHCCGGSGKA